MDRTVYVKFHKHQYSTTDTSQLQPTLLLKWHLSKSSIPSIYKIKLSKYEHHTW